MVRRRFAWLKTFMGNLLSLKVTTLHHTAMRSAHTQNVAGMYSRIPPSFLVFRLYLAFILACMLGVRDRILQCIPMLFFRSQRKMLSN